MVLSILAYGSIVWRAALGNKLGRIQRTAFASATGALKSYRADVNYGEVQERRCVGSKMVFGVRRGVCFGQAELLVILEVCRWLGHDPNRKIKVANLIDSQAAIKALSSITTSSRLVGLCRNVRSSLCDCYRNVEGIMSMEWSRRIPLLTAPS